MKPCRLSFIAILALVWGVLGISQAEAADQRPNILLVVADDMGWTDLGSIGSSDRIDESGLRCKRSRRWRDAERQVDAAG